MKNQNQQQDKATPGPLQWVKRSVGGYITTDGFWNIRGPIMGKPMYWLYRSGNRGVQAGGERYTPTGSYDDCVSFISVKQAKLYAQLVTEHAALVAVAEAAKWINDTAWLKWTQGQWDDLKAALDNLAAIRAQQ